MMEKIAGICIIALLCLLIIFVLVFAAAFIASIIYLKKNIIEQQNGKTNILEIKVNFSPISIEDKRIVDSGQKEPAALPEMGEKEVEEEKKVEEDKEVDNGGMDLSGQSSENADIAQLSQTVPKSEEREDFADIDKWFSTINVAIAKKGYAAWIGEKDSWKRIGTGDRPQEVGDKVTLKIGAGNIRVTGHKGVICGIPGKAQWKECDFKSGAYYECYQIPEGIDSSSDYEVKKIKECAILIQEKDGFHVVRKGAIEVEKL